MYAIYFHSEIEQTVMHNHDSLVPMWKICKKMNHENKY
jgi:hypothetical protein